MNELMNMIILLLIPMALKSIIVVRSKKASNSGTCLDDSALKSSSQMNNGTVYYNCQLAFLAKKNLH